MRHCHCCWKRPAPDPLRPLFQITLFPLTSPRSPLSPTPAHQCFCFRNFRVLFGFRAFGSNKISFRVISKGQSSTVWTLFDRFLTVVESSRKRFRTLHLFREASIDRIRKMFEVSKFVEGKKITPSHLSWTVMFITYSGFPSRPPISHLSLKSHLTSHQHSGVAQNGLKPNSVSGAVSCIPCSLQRSTHIW